MDKWQKMFTSVVPNNSPLASPTSKMSTQVIFMAQGKELKRENFDVSPEQQADIETLQAVLETPSKKEAVLMAVHLALHLAAEIRKGHQFFVGHPGEALLSPE